MDVTCEKCQTEYEFDDALVSEQGTSVRCTQCGHRFKVKRPDGSAPEIWIVRTVEGQTLEFRALRELKSAIGAGKVGKDDVLSRGAGRPRRLASIAELEPFFVVVAPPPKLLHTNMGLGSIESAQGRRRSNTPYGLGPNEVTPMPPVTDVSVAMALAQRDAINVPPPSDAPTGQHKIPDVSKGRTLHFGPADTTATAFDEEEKTVNRTRAVTRELRGLGEEPAPPSFEPATEKDPLPSRVEPAPRTIMGPGARQVSIPEAAPTRIDPLMAQRAALLKTAAQGTPRDVEVGSIQRPPPSPPVEEPAPAAPPPPDSVPEAEPSTKRRREGRSALAPPAVSDSAPQSRPQSSRRVKSQLEDTVVKDEGTPPPPPAETPPPTSTGERRSSVVTPTPAEVRYSIADHEPDRELHDRRTSAASSRPASSPLKLFVVVVLGGLVAFGGVLLVQRFVLKAPSAADSRVADLVAAGEKAMRDGDLEEAQQKLAGASTLDEKDPRVVRALARLAVVRAELAWLELRVLPADDPGRDAVKRRFEDVGKRAQAATDKAAATEADVDLATLRMDTRRIGGDLAAAEKERASLTGQDSKPDVAIALAALELAADAPAFDKAIPLLEKAAKEEGSLGRARALLVYALGRSGDGKRAREEIDKLSKLPRSHPLEAALRRFVERVEKGESVALNVTDLPTIPTASGSGAAGDPETGSLRAAQEALAHGQLDVAEQLFQKMVDRDAQSSEGLLGLASVARQRGQTKRAISIYERVVAANPSSVSAVLSLADMKWDAGDRSGAATLYRRAMDLGTTADRARERSGGGSAPPSDATTSSGSGAAPTGTSTGTGAPTATSTGTAAPPPTGTTDATTGGGPPPEGPATTSGSDVPPWEGAP